MKSIVQWIGWLYVATNTIRIFFYAPQILAVLRCGDGARGVSIATWGFWTFANLTGALYGFFVVRDRTFAFIFVGNFVCTAMVTAVAAVKRMKQRVVAVPR